MAELQRKPQTRKDQLTTADLAGRNEQQEWDTGPTLVRTENERADAAKATPLFAETEVTELRHLWSDVQSAFVDEPRKAVEEADKLVATVMQRLAEGFAKERSDLEDQWTRGGDVSTEDLRLALQRYRSFFDRLLNA